MLVRAEGESELLNDIVFTCTGGTPGAIAQANLTLFFDVPVTSHILDPVSGTSEALLIIDDLASTPAFGSNIFQGVIDPNAPTQIQFLNVPIVEPADPATRKLRFTNLRINARAQSDQIVVGGLTVSSPPAIAVRYPALPVAVKTPGLAFSLENASNQPVANITFQQAGGENTALAGSASASGGIVNYDLRFKEGNARGFRKRNTATSVINPLTLADQNIPGRDYATETGFYGSSLPAGNHLPQAGLATNGTRLMARFSRVPAGVAVYVTTAPLPNSPSNGARLIATDTSGAGPYSAISATTTANAGGTAVGIAPVSLINGSGIAVWEVRDADPTTLDSFTFGVVVAYLSPQPGVTASVGGVLAPLSSTLQADAGSPIPRFADTSADPPACSSPPCLTVSPNAVSIGYQIGSTPPAPIAVQVGSTGPSIAFTASPAVTGGIPWLAVSAGGSSTPASITIMMNPANLAAAVYKGSIDFRSADGTLLNAIPVILTVTQGSAPQPLSCIPTTTFSPASFRSEGVAELVPVIGLFCTGGTAGVPVHTGITVHTSGPITSRILNPATGATEILLENDVPSIYMPAPVSKISQGILIDPYTVNFPNVTIDLPSGDSASNCPFPCRKLAITNIRMNASKQLPWPPPRWSASHVFASVSMSGATVLDSILFPSGNIYLGQPSPSQSFSLQTVAGSSATAAGRWAERGACVVGACRRRRVELPP